MCKVITLYSAIVFCLYLVVNIKPDHYNNIVIAPIDNPRTVIICKGIDYKYLRTFAIDCSDGLKHNINDKNIIVGYETNL